jgi:hypothetical protein
MRLGSFVYQVTQGRDFGFGTGNAVRVGVRRWRVIDADPLTVCVTRRCLVNGRDVAFLERKDAHECLTEATARRSALAESLRREGKTVTEETRIDEDY